MLPVTFADVITGDCVVEMSCGNDNTYRDASWMDNTELEELILLLYMCKLFIGLVVPIPTFPPL